MVISHKSLVQSFTYLLSYLGNKVSVSAIAQVPNLHCPLSFAIFFFCLKLNFRDLNMLGSLRSLSCLHTNISANLVVIVEKELEPQRLELPT